MKLLKRFAALHVMGCLFASSSFADPSTLSGIDTSGIATPSSTSICNLPHAANDARYNFYCGGAPAGVAPKVGPVNPAVNQFNQMGQQMIYNGIQNLFNSNDKTPEQAEAERQAAALHQQQENEAKRAKEEADHQKLKVEMKLSGSTNSDNGLKRHTDEEEEKKDSPGKQTDAFNKGYEHASGCFSQNSMSACGAVSAELTDVCLADYRKGYQAGDERRKQAMAEANRTGKQAGVAGQLDNSASDSRAEGPCRVQWIEAYGQGYFEGKASH